MTTHSKLCHLSRGGAITMHILFVNPTQPMIVLCLVERCVKGRHHSSIATVTKHMPLGMKWLRLDKLVAMDLDIRTTPLTNRSRKEKEDSLQSSVPTLMQCSGLVLPKGIVGCMQTLLQAFARVPAILSAQSSQRGHGCPNCRLKTEPSPSCEFVKVHQLTHRWDWTFADGKGEKCLHQRPEVSEPPTKLEALEDGVLSVWKTQDCKPHFEFKPITQALIITGNCRRRLSLLESRENRYGNAPRTPRRIKEHWQCHVDVDDGGARGFFMSCGEADHLCHHYTLLFAPLMNEFNIFVQIVWSGFLEAVLDKVLMDWWKWARLVNVQFPCT
uniref:Uncharacterized protein n=1 Tax=Strigamia maritima TaxID=126957 RepID=T1J7W2_STRMM